MGGIPGVYVARAQFVEGLSVLNGVKPNVVEAVASEGLVPGCLSEAQWAQDMPKRDKYIWATGASTASHFCRIHAEFEKDRNISNFLKNKSVCLIYNANTNEWVCGTDVDAKVRPSTCKYSNCHGNPITWVD